MGSLVTILALPLTAALTLGAGPAAMGLLAIPFLVLSPLASTSAGTVANIQQWSLRQVVTPDYLFGRVTASHRFIVYGIEAAGVLMGGVLGGLLGPRLAIAGWSPLRRLRVQPEPA